MRRQFCVLALVALASCAAPAPAGTPRFAIYFQEWSAALDSEAQGAVTAAAKEANQQANAPVQVVGYADPTGSAQANVDISRLRAQVVSDALTANGVAPVRITRATRGATNFALSSQESRRVEILVGP